MSKRQTKPLNPIELAVMAWMMGLATGLFAGADTLVMAIAGIVAAGVGAFVVACEARLAFKAQREVK